MSNPLVVSPDQTPAPLKMVGEEVTVLASAGQTDSDEIAAHGLNVPVPSP